MDSQNASTDHGFIVDTTIYNGSSTQDTPSVQVPLNLGIIILTTCSILCNSVALYIIHGCRKLSFQIRFVTYNLLASYILFEFMIILHSVAMLFFGDLYHKQIYDSRTFFSCALVATLWSSLCAVTVERLVALTIPLHYNRYVTKTTLSISIACLWIETILPPSLTYTITGVKVCGQHHYISCDMHAHFQSTALVIISFEPWHEISNNLSFLTILDSDKPMQPPVKLRNSKWWSVSSLTIIEYSSD